MKYGIGIPTSHQGVYLPSPFAGPKEITSVTQLAEKLGFYSAWGLDFITPTESRHKVPGQLPQWHEVIISLAYLAAATKKIKLGTATVVLPHRDPVLLAKQTATLDVLSGGRFLLGVGLGGSRDEFEAIMPRMHDAHRGTMYVESLELLNLLLSKDNASYKGKYFEFNEVSFNPKPIQKPFPIYISGKTDDTPRRVAKYGSGWLLSRAQVNPPIPERIEQLYPFLEAEGRKRSDIDVVVTKGLSLGKTHEEALERFQKSMLPGRMDVMAARPGIGGKPSVDRVYHQNFVGTPDDVIEQIEKVKKDDVDHCVIFYFAVNTFQDMMEQAQWFGEDVLPKVR